VQFFINRRIPAIVLVLRFLDRGKDVSMMAGILIGGEDGSQI
jgi:hypothetical protein